jgi:hypothetical protein
VKKIYRALVPPKTTKYANRTKESKTEHKTTQNTRVTRMPHSTYEASEASSKQKTYVSIPTVNDRISDYSPASLRQLAHVLYPFAGDNIQQESWEEYQAQEIAALPACLLQPRSSDLEPLNPDILSTQLCALHAPLNALLIHKIFIEVISECTTRLESLASEPLESLPPNVREHLLRMQSLNSLWMCEELYELAYGEDAICYERVESGCQACILSAVGYDHIVLKDLMAAIYGRKRRGKPHDGLIHVVSQFLLCLKDGWALVLDARELGTEIVRTRKQLQAERRMRRRQKKGREKKYMEKQMEDRQPSVFEEESSLAVSEEETSLAVSEEESSLGAVMSYYFRQSMARQTAIATRQAGNSSLGYKKESICFDKQNSFFYKVGSPSFPIPLTSPSCPNFPLSPSVYSQDDDIDARRESTMRKLMGEATRFPSPRSPLTQQIMSTKARGKQREEARPRRAHSPRRPKRSRSSQPLQFKLSEISEHQEESFPNTKAPSRHQRQRAQDLGNKRYTFYENPRAPPAPPVRRRHQQVSVNRVTQMGDFIARQRRGTRAR